ncbi:MAG: phosphoglycerate dehydrogenase [Chloroflexi bacterium]|nr:phosphoglycerate dehydrogenase [Chloroflexota bacterium]
MKVLVTDALAEEGVDLVRQFCDVEVRRGLRPEQLIDIIPGCDGLLVRSETKVTPAVIEAGRDLKVIGRAGVGVDNIDLEAATMRGIVVLNAPTSVTGAASEHTIALLLAMARHVPDASQSTKSGEWKRSRFIGVEVRGKTLGLVGLGNIGAQVAQMAQGLRMSVVGFDPYVSADHAARMGIGLVSLEALLATSDFISIHVPLTPSTRGFIGRKELQMAKRGARLINCARGGLVDESALLEALDEGWLAGAALDVFAQEPPVGSPLLKHPKLIATPHLGASTEEAQVTAAIDVANQVIAVLSGQGARYAVNAPTMRPETMAILGPYVELGEKLGQLFTQLADAQLSTIEVVYNGELADYDTLPVKAGLVKGLLESACEEPINLINALPMAKSRGIQIVEAKSTETIENYTNLVTLRVPGARGVRELAGTVVRKKPHVVRINHHWVDVVPSGGFLLFTEHRDCPGVIGKVASLLGAAGVNISFIQASRVEPNGEQSEPRGQQIMALGVDDFVSDEVYASILQIEEIRSAKRVKL